MNDDQHAQSSEDSFPSSARVVIVGVGIIGRSLEEFDSVRGALDFGRGFGVDVEEISISEIQAI